MNDAMIDLSVQRLGLADPGDGVLIRGIAVEAPVSVEVGGIGYAVMMATPSDLEDYALGFALSEGLVATVEQIERVDVHPVEGGWALRIWVPPERKAIAIRQRAQDLFDILDPAQPAAALAHPLACPLDRDRLALRADRAG